MNKLTQIGIHNHTDKAIFGYLDVYEEHFNKFTNNDAITIAEVGVLGGSSLRTWRCFFPNSKIIGIDKVKDSINERGETVQNDFFRSDSNSKFFLCDQGKTEDLISLKNILINENIGIDVFIDDGSHFQKDMIQTFEIMFPLLNKGGIYIIEDICTTKNLLRGDKWWGDTKLTSIENCVEQTILNFKNTKKLKSDFFISKDSNELESSIQDCFFYKDQTHPLTIYGTSSLAILIKK
jgi:hypothetical protein